MHKSTAWPLALLYTMLVVYASLFPFADWRDQGVASWEFLFAPPAQYWTGFDVAVNVVGYVPLGCLVALAALRSGGRTASVWWAALGVGMVSLLMEGLQSYLPMRVPSREDFVLNALGAWMGAALAWGVQWAGLIERWSQLRRRWLVPESRGGLVLLAMWPVALLFPAAVPLGLGQVLGRLQHVLEDALDGSALALWLPQRAVDTLVISPSLELVCVALGLWIPCLLGLCVVRPGWRRLVLVAAVWLVAVLVSALSAALSWGPLHAWAWLGVPAQVGLALGAALAVLCALLPWRVNAAVALLALGAYVSLLNQAPESPYFAQTLQLWEQGRFIRFHGLAQWVGWLWPYAALVYLLGLVGRRHTKN